MKNRFIGLNVFVGLLFCGVSAFGGTVTLKASKDNCGRSNERHRNSGGNDTLYIAHAPNVKTVMAFDLSSVTNRITGATLRFRQSSANPDPVVLTAAPLVHTEGNSAWSEGAGARGAQGRNAMPGESCYAWRSFPDGRWEKAAGVPVNDLGDVRIWDRPLVTGKRLSWAEGAWVEIKLTDAAALEKIRTAGNPTVTLGIWGTSGKGLYAISSRESGHAPELVLVTDDPPEEQGQTGRIPRS